MMREKTYKYRKFPAFLAMVLLIFTSCERDLDEDADLATFPSIAEVYTDNPVNLTDEFFISFDPAEGANTAGFGTDDNVAYEGTSSIRIDVPDPNDPGGSFIGGIFKDRGAGRNLTGFDALTFWVKGSTSASVEFGFGTDFEGDKYAVDLANVTLSTYWRQVIIPIPDPAKLVQEKGMFKFAAGTISTGGLAYTFWIDEIRFEKLGTVAQPRPKILLGQDQFQQTFNGSQLNIGGLTETFNLGNGQDVTVNVAPGYFDFSSSNTAVATVNEFGAVTVVGAGTASVTATLAGIDAEGSLTVDSQGEFQPAPIPDEDPVNVISIFSDAYTNVPVDYYNGFFNGDGQTTQGGAPPININGDEVINYTDLNFVGIGTFLNVPSIDATSMTHLHVDINVQEPVDPGDFITLVLINSVGNDETSGSVTINSADLVSGEWGSYDIPLGEFTELGSRDQLGLLFFVSDASISNIYVDNIYYYKEVIDPSPNVDDSAATEVALPIGFQSTTLTYDIIGFEGAEDTSVDANPDPSGINPTSRVVRSLKASGGQFFAGSLLNLDSPIDFSASQKFRMKVWSPKAGIPVRVRLEDQNNTAGIELDSNTTTSNVWEEIEWDFSGVYNPSVDYVRIVVFFEFIPGLPGDGSTYYYDDIQIVD